MKTLNEKELRNKIVSNPINSLYSFPRKINEKRDVVVVIPPAIMANDNYILHLMSLFILKFLKFICISSHERKACQ